MKYSFSRSMKECRNQTSGFREMLDVCSLVDLGFEGRRWTFEKKHYYRMDLLSRAVTAFSPGYRAGTTILGLKVEPSVPGHRARTKEGPLVPVGVTNRD